MPDSDAVAEKSNKMKEKEIKRLRCYFFQNEKENISVTVGQSSEGDNRVQLHEKNSDHKGPGIPESCLCTRNASH